MLQNQTTAVGRIIIRGMNITDLMSITGIMVITKITGTRKRKGKKPEAGKGKERIIGHKMIRSFIAYLSAPRDLRYAFTAVKDSRFSSQPVCFVRIKDLIHFI